MIVNPSSGSGAIADGSITNIKIADATISSAKLDASLNAIISAGSIAEGSITSFHIANGAILTTDISNHAITYDKLAVDSVSNTRIINGAVTHAKLSSHCVESHNIVDGTILGTDICGNTITGSNIAEGTITSYNIANGTILNTDISGGTIKGSNISEGTITSYNILDGTILGTDISGATIQGSNIADGAITRAKLSELTANLIIHNAFTSTAVLHYNIKLNNAGTITNYFDFPMGGIGNGMTHSVRVCIPNITTQIKVEIDPEDISVLSAVVGSGGIQVGTFTDDTLTFTFDAGGYNNIEIGFTIEVDKS